MGCDVKSAYVKQTSSLSARPEQTDDRLEIQYVPTAMISTAQIWLHLLALQLSIQ